MRFYAYKLSENHCDRFNSILNKIHNQKCAGFNETLRKVNGAPIRFEYIEYLDDYWIIDLSRKVISGAHGDASDIEPMVPIKFQSGHYPSQATAILLHPESGFVIMQSQQSCVTKSALSTYLHYLEGKENRERIEFLIVKDEETMSKYGRMNKAKKLRFKVFAPVISRAAEMDPAVSSITGLNNISKDAHGKDIEITISNKDKSWLNIGFVKTCSNLLKEIHSDEPDMVSRLEVSGKESDEQRKTQVLDLLRLRLFRDFNNLKLDENHVYKRDDRIECLQKCYHEWEDFKHQNK